jgi:GntR family transcriptional regulator / MocR family aminotransferase
VEDASISPARPSRGPRTLPMLLVLDRGGAVPMHRQVYLALRRAILEARLPAGRRVPSTRALAQDLGVSRTTILGAYDQLAAEGFLESHAGGGSRVTDVVPATGPHRTSGQPAARRAAAPLKAPPLSAAGIASLGVYGWTGRPMPPLAARAAIPPRRCVPFALGIPALDAFPVHTWTRLTARHWRRDYRNLMLPDDGPGYRPLREAIAEYVFTARGVRCTADQVIVTAGALQGVVIAARLLLNPGDQVWLEEPGFSPARAAFAGVGAQVVPVPVDHKGLDVARGRILAPKARMAFVTPSFQAPMGVVMDLSRRVALLDWATAAGSWVIEDDYNGEFRYDGHPLAAMQGLEHPGAGRVVFLGTFSKTLFPALRLGYVVVPPELVEAFAVARMSLDRHSPVIEQAVLADFIQEGHFARHVREMRHLYAERQGQLVALARRETGDLLTVDAAPCGMRLLGWLPPGVSDVEVAAESARRGIDVLALSRLCLKPPARGALLLGYAPFSALAMQRALRALAACIHDCAARPRRRPPAKGTPS